MDGGLRLGFGGVRFGEALEFFALGGTRGVVLGEDTLEQPGGGAPTGGAGRGGVPDNVELALAEFLAGLAEELGELGPLLFPAGDGGGADAEGQSGGAIGAASLADEGGEETPLAGGREGGAAGAARSFGLWVPSFGLAWPESSRFQVPRFRFCGGGRFRFWGVGFEFDPAWRP